MTALTISDITAAPAGYSFQTVADHWQDEKRHLWMHIDAPWQRSVVELYHISGAFSLPVLFKRNDNGDITYDQSAFDARAASSNLNAIRPIPDSELPTEGMTRYHTHFNDTTRKFELPIINADIAHAHERNHDSDVAAAVATICHVDIDLMHRNAMLANLNAAEAEKARGKYGKFDECMDIIVDANAEPALEHAWLKSLGDIRHTGRDNPEVEFVTAAHDFATSWQAHIATRTEAQLAASRYEYHLCLFQSLMADRGKTDNRFLPRGVTIVKRKSSPAKAEEMTAAQVFAKVKAVIAPAEGAPKGG